MSKKFSCKGCFYDDLEIKNYIYFCLTCKRAYRKNTERYKTFEDKYERNDKNEKTKDEEVYS